MEGSVGELYDTVTTKNYLRTVQRFVTFHKMFSTGALL
jgi:hypothetical protein